MSKALLWDFYVRARIDMTRGDDDEILALSSSNAEDSNACDTAAKKQRHAALSGEATVCATDCVGNWDGWDDHCD